MADAVIELVGQEDLPLIVDLYGQIFRPARTIESFQRRYEGRNNVLQLLARVDDVPVGFFVGFEEKPSVFFSWFYAVMPEYRRQGVASQMMEAVHDWVRMNDYDSIRFECHNQHRPMLHLGIERGYDLVGIRWDPDRSENMILFQKTLNSNSFNEEW